MQGRAIAIYKGVGSFGFLIGSLQGPLFLTYLGYDGGWCVFLGIYLITITLICIIYPDLSKNKSDDKILAVEETKILPAQVYNNEAANAAPERSIKDLTFMCIIKRRDL